MKKALFFVLLLSTILLLTGCLPGDGRNTSEDPAGFLWGIWHGWVAPLSLILGLFRDHIRVYEVANTGWWYDLGFYAAVISGFGGLSLIRRKEK
ncbi:MAG TPA: hypothetical protein DDW87_13150 [Firmicutes bacterium]|nr:hypothetical protein [Bacillota bacterium]